MIDQAELPVVQRPHCDQRLITHDHLAVNEGPAWQRTLSWVCQKLLALCKFVKLADTATLMNLKG